MRMNKKLKRDKTWIVNLFNNKLYTQYYPIASEEQKAIFLENNHTKILRSIKRLKDDTLFEYYSRQKEYISRMKSEVSCLGHLKLGNICRNRSIAYEMSRDKRINTTRKVLQDLDSLKDKLISHEQESITIYELNNLLKMMNETKHRNMCKLGLSLIITIILLCVFWQYLL